MKKIFILALSIFTALAFSACSKTEPSTVTPIELSAADFAAVIDPLFNTAAMASLDSARMQREFDSIDETLIAEFVMMVPTGTNQDEYGVFVATDNSAAAIIRDAVINYFEKKREAWMNEYIPEERGKLDSAEVKIFAGKYVVYAIADSGMAAATLEAAEDLTTAK